MRILSVVMIEHRVKRYTRRKTAQNTCDIWVTRFSGAASVRPTKYHLVAYRVTQSDVSSQKTILRRARNSTVAFEIRFNEKGISPFLRRTKKIYAIYSGIARAYPRRAGSPAPDFRRTTRFLFYWLKRALFFMRTRGANGNGPIARSRLSPLDANKSRNSDASSTRGFRVCRWNLISAAFVTKHTVVLFSPFPRSSSSTPTFFHFHRLRLLLPHRHSSFALFSQRDRRITHDLCLKYTLEYQTRKQEQREKHHKLD